MSAPTGSVLPGSSPRTNGGAAAAILSSGFGCFTFAVLAILGDKSGVVHRGLIFYKPTGVLSGASTVSILLWLLIWLILHRLWRNKTVAEGRTCTIALVLLVAALLLTFPPIAGVF
jgi:hypothetical protein